MIPVDRRLVAILACRVGGQRLYGKPLQNLAPGVTLLSQVVGSIRSLGVADEVVLAIADAPGNDAFELAANELGCPFTHGDEEDVLARVIDAAERHGATDVLRKTSESPFMALDETRVAWERHVARDNDVTVVDYVPLGTATEVYSLESLQRSHREGLDEDRGEHVSNYARFNQERFRVDIVEPDASIRRPEVRLTVDYPEDLIVSRRVYGELGGSAPAIPLGAIVEFLDSHPELTALVERYAHPHPMWAGVAQRQG